MIALAWTVVALLALLWTGAAWITAAATGWAAQALASGTASQAARDLAVLPVPDWLKLFIDPAWLQGLQAAVQWALDGAGSLLPFVGSATGWLVPAIWIAWGLGLALLLAAAVTAHVLVRRLASGATRRDTVPRSA